jgi:hypothetical protein
MVAVPSGSPAEVRGKTELMRCPQPPRWVAVVKRSAERRHCEHGSELGFRPLFFHETLAEAPLYIRIFLGPRRAHQGLYLVYEMDLMGVYFDAIHGDFLLGKSSSVASVLCLATG